MTIDPKTRDITKVVATNRLVVRNDPAITADTVIGSITTGLSNSRSDGACNMLAGDLIADSQLAATQPASFGGAAMASTNGDGGRTSGFTFASSAAGEGNGNGNVTYGKAFTVQPFGNSLVTLSLSSQSIKDFLEEQFSGCLGQSTKATRFALPSAGFKYTWDGAKACGSRISNVTLHSGSAMDTLVNSAGVVQNPTKSYRVTVNNFMADGGDGTSTLLKGTNRIGGARDIDALTAFLANFKAPKATYALGANAVDAGSPRINRVGSSATCPSGASVNP